MTVSKRPVICQGCRTKFVRTPSNFEKDSRGYWHKACYQEKKQEQASRQDLMSLALGVIGEGVNPAFVQKQINKFTKEYGYTHSGIKGTIYYFTEVKKVKPIPKFGLAFVPYNYEKARNYFEKMSEMSQLEEFQALEIKTVTIKEPISKRYDNKPVELEDLFTEEELRE